MNIIIPIGGKGERFSKVGYTLPKPLIKVLDKTIIEYVLDNLHFSPEDDVYIFYHHHLDEYNFSDFISKKYPHITLVKIYIQTRGASETILLGCEPIVFRYSNTVLLDCDTFYTEDVIKMYRESIHKNVVFYRQVSINSPPIYSYIETDTNNKIKNIIEKVSISTRANTGIYCFSDIKQLLKYIYIVLDNNEYTKEPYTSYVIKRMIKDNVDFYSIKVNGVISLGTPEEVDEFLKK